MSRIAYVNGQYVPFFNATVHVEDRGYQFADGVYEVIAVQNSLPIDLILHLNRLDRSLSALCLEWPLSKEALSVVLRVMVARNHLREGVLYVQISRGVAKREHAFPPLSVRSALVVTARAHALATNALFEKGVRIVTMADLRWKRCDIKSIALLPNAIARQMAHAQGAFETWLLASDRTITEGTSSNAWIVTVCGQVITRPLSSAILGGITRGRVLDLANQLSLKIIERSFNLEEAKQANEAFLTNSTSFVLPVISIDGKQINNGQPGAITRRLRMAYLSVIANRAAGW